MTMKELREIAAEKGIKLTEKGYRLEGMWYPVEDWHQVLRRVQNYHPLAAQMDRWMRQA